MLNNTENSQHEILLGLTTTPSSDWIGKVEEMKKFGIKKIALFPTFLGVEKRRELYNLLEQIEGLEIPHVHLREEDMEAWEMDWFESKGTEAYNVHPNNLENKVLEPYYSKMYVENRCGRTIPGCLLEELAGICLDFQHWKLAIKEVALATRNSAEKYTIGCSHVSPLPKTKNIFWRVLKRVDDHYLISLDELNYIGQYQQYLPKYISLELENSFEEQLKAKQYLEKLLNF